MRNVKTHEEILTHFENEYKYSLEKYERYKKYLSTDPSKRIEALPFNLQKKVLEKRNSCINYPSLEEEVLVLCEYAVKLLPYFKTIKEVRSFQKEYKKSKDLSIFKECDIDLDQFIEKYNPYLEEHLVVHRICEFIVSCIDYTNFLNKKDNNDDKFES